jgi:hypothetical protein
MNLVDREVLRVQEHDGFDVRVSMPVDDQVYVGVQIIAGSCLGRQRHSLGGTATLVAEAERVALERCWKAFDLERHIRPLAAPLG